jgi:hypothetical protein
MAVDFITTQPQHLLNEFRSRIKQAASTGKITTWEVDADGDFSHKAANWRHLAWFRPSVRQGALRFNIIKPQGQSIAITTYGYYHGHLTETFLNHFDSLFSQAISSAQPILGDVVN